MDIFFVCRSLDFGQNREVAVFKIEHYNAVIFKFEYHYCFGVEVPGFWTKSSIITPLFSGLNTPNMKFAPFFEPMPLNFLL